MTSPWLTAEELKELTGRKRWSAQARALARMGIPFQPSAQGRPLVERSRVLTEQTAPKTRRAEPDWSALRRAA